MARVLRSLLLHPLVAATAFTVLLLGGTASASDNPGAQPEPWVTPVPKAHCQPGDRTETGLQGQLTLAERASGASTIPYNCNLEIVGQYEGEGADHQLVWYKNCAYYSTLGNPLQQHLGVVTIDASDPRNPFPTAYLDAAAFVNPWESMNVNRYRKLIGGVGFNSNTFALYDVSDCRHPVLASSVALPDATLNGHGGNFAPDGRTFYGVDLDHCSVYAIDTTDPHNPELILNWHTPAGYCAHNVSVSDDGTRLYIGQPGCGMFPANVCGFNLPDGLVIADISEIQFRRPNPQITIISHLFWNDSSIGEVSQSIRIRGRRFLYFTSELGSGGSRASTACAANLPPWGFPRLIDISDELHPFVTTKLKLEVDDPANCPLDEFDIPLTDGFGYSAHECTVDNVRDAHLLACSYEESGVRVFDIHDPYHPRELAYYKGAARGTGPVLPGSALAHLVDPTFTQAKARSRFVHHGEDLYLWMTSVDSGFLIGRFENMDEIRHILSDGK